METHTVLLRLSITFVLAILFGFERQRSHKPIGFGTFTFVSTGSTALAILALTVYGENPLPLLSAIVTGIGFLGAGALIKTSDKIFGFTSASSIWIFAIFGLAIGIGEYIIGGILYVLIIMVIIIDRYFERNGVGSYQKKLTIVTNKIINQKEINTTLLLASTNFKLISFEVNRKESQITFIYLIEGRKEGINSLPRKLYEKEWLLTCRIE